MRYTASSAENSRRVKETRSDVSRSGERARNVRAKKSTRRRVARGYDVPPERSQFFATHRCTTRNVEDGDGSTVHRETNSMAKGERRKGKGGIDDRRRRNEIYFTRVTTKKPVKNTKSPPRTSRLQVSPKRPRNTMPLATFVFPFFLTCDSKIKKERDRKRDGKRKGSPATRSTHAVRREGVVGGQDRIFVERRQAKKKGEETRRHKARCEKKEEDKSETSSAKETVENDGTKTILKIGAKGVSTCTLAIGRSPKKVSKVTLNC